MKDQNNYPFTEIQRHALALFGRKDTCSCTSTAYRLHGAIDVNKLENAIWETIKENDVFRWKFEFSNGEIAYQYVLDEVNFSLDVIPAEGVTNREKEEYIVRMGKEVLDKTSQINSSRLYRFVLFQISKEESVFLMAFNHLLTDGIANGIVIMSIIMKYNGILFSNPSKQYIDFLADEDRFLKSVEGEKQVDYWKELTGDYHMNYISFPNENREKSKIRPLISVPAKMIRNIAMKNKTSTFVVALFLLHMALMNTYSVDDMVVNVMEGNRTKDFRHTMGLLSYSYATRFKRYNERNMNELLAEFVKQYNAGKNTRLAYCAPNASVFFVVYQNFNANQKMSLGSAQMEPYGLIYEERFDDHAVFVGTETFGKICFDFIADSTVFPDSIVLSFERYFYSGLRILNAEEI